jgi:16S rRNA (uracil1498-N3)-methyltransferase
MRRFYARPDQFDGDSVELSADETRHLRDVLRLRPGAEVSVFDGEGREFAAAVGTISKTSSVLKLLGENRPTSPESPLDLQLAAALLKSEKFDLVVQKAVELGVNRLTPLITHRCDVKLNERASRIDRWQRIALEACKQSGRARLMAIDPPRKFWTLIGELADDRSTEGVIFAERGGGDFGSITSGIKMTALVGPEGGWEDEELGTARDAGLSLVTLGGRILRAETAAIAVAAIMQHRFGDIN